MRRAILVDIHGEAGIFAHQRAGSAGVVQVDVCEKNGLEIADSDATGLELSLQRLERGARAGVDNGAVPVRFQKAGRDGARPSHPKVVEGGDGVHQKSSVAQDGKFDCRQLPAAQRNGVSAREARKKLRQKRIVE